MRRILALSLLSLALPAAASAAGSGGAAATGDAGTRGEAPATGGSDRTPAGARADAPGTGGAVFGRTPPRADELRRRASRPRRRRARGRSSARPVLNAFAVRPGRFYVYGRPARVDFTIRARARTVRVKLRVTRPGSRRVLASVDLGERPTGVPQRVRLSGREGERVLPQGALELRLWARDSRGRGLRRSARSSSVQRLEFFWHRFPLRGAFSYGGEGARFGAERPGRSHQGQDLVAAEGTPVVAPRGGVVQTVAYQAGGAGHYVILDGAGEDRDYAFMHLQTGSIAVRAGQRVRTGQVLARVGSTGASSGPHLHFEVWERGGWFEGGEPVDPLPYLRRWDAWS